MKSNANEYRPITARDGLLYRGNEAIPLPEADAVAAASGFRCAEEMVRSLTQPTTFGDLEKLSAAYDNECNKLEDLVAALEADMELVRRQHIAGLKRQAAVVANREAELHSAIERSPQLFVKPKTVTINGVKQGFAYSPGSIVWDDDAQVVAAIREKRPREFKTLVDVKEVPRKAALKAMSEAELKEIGCRIEGEGDAVVLKRVAGDVEKMIGKVIEKLVAAMVSDK